MLIYVAGPMTGIPHFNFPAFDQAADELRGRGHTVCNPAEHDRETYGDKIEASETGDPAEAAAHGFDLRDALAYDLTWIAHNADAVAVLPGWENSRGARAEVALARALRLPVADVGEFEHDGIMSPLTEWELDLAASQGYHHVAARNALAQKVMRDAVDGALAAGEIRTTSTTGGEKGVKPARFDLIPAAPLWQVAEHYGRGAAKYDARNWERGYEWSKSFGALMRHAWAFWRGEDMDDETGSHHMAAVAFHALALIEFGATHPEFDDRTGRAA